MVGRVGRCRAAGRRAQRRERRSGRGRRVLGAGQHLFGRAGFDNPASTATRSATCWAPA